MTGSGDGWVRVCGLFPHTVKVFEQHADSGEDSNPINKIDISSCKRILASISDDYCVRFYDISEITEFMENSEKTVLDTIVEDKNISEKKAKEKTKNLDFFEEL